MPWLSRPDGSETVGLSRAAFAADVAALIEHSNRGGPVPLPAVDGGAHRACAG